MKERRPRRSLVKGESHTGIDSIFSVTRPARVGVHTGSVNPRRDPLKMTSISFSLKKKGRTERMDPVTLRPLVCRSSLKTDRTEIRKVYHLLYRRMSGFYEASEGSIHSVILWEGVERERHTHTHTYLIRLN